MFSGKMRRRAHKPGPAKWHLLTFRFVWIPSRNTAATAATRTAVEVAGIAFRSVSETRCFLYQIDVTHALSFGIDVETGSGFDSISAGCRARAPFTPAWFRRSGRGEKIVRERKAFSLNAEITTHSSECWARRSAGTPIFMMLHNVPFGDHALRIDLIHIRLYALGNHTDAGVGLDEVRLRADLTCRLVREQTCPGTISAPAGDRTFGPLAPRSRGAAHVPHAVRLTCVLLYQRDCTSGSFGFGDGDVVPGPDSDSLTTSCAAGRPLRPLGNLTFTCGRPGTREKKDRMSDKRGIVELYRGGHRKCMNVKTIPSGKGCMRRWKGSKYSGEVYVAGYELDRNRGKDFRWSPLIEFAGKRQPLNLLCLI